MLKLSGTFSQIQYLQKRAAKKADESPKEESDKKKEDAATANTQTENAELSENYKNVQNFLDAYSQPVYTNTAESTSKNRRASVDITSSNDEETLPEATEDTTAETTEEEMDSIKPEIDAKLETEYEKVQSELEAAKAERDAEIAKWEAKYEEMQSKLEHKLTDADLTKLETEIDNAINDALDAIDKTTTNNTSNKKLTENEIKSAIKSAAPDIYDWELNQLLSVITSYADTLDISDIGKAVGELMNYFLGSSSNIVYAAGSVNSETKESYLQETFKSVINAHYSYAVNNKDNENKNTIEIKDLQALYTQYCLTDLYDYNASNGLDIYMQGVIDSNHYNFSLSDLKAFFKDLKEKMPGGRMASSQYKILSFMDFIKNGYREEKDETTTVIEKISLKRPLTSAYEELILNDENTGNNDENTANKTTLTQEEIRANLIRKFPQLATEEEREAMKAELDYAIKNVFKTTTQELIDKIVPSKPELRELVSDIMANDDDVDPSGMNQYGYFSERELDTFVDSIISQVVKNSDTQDVETLLSEIKDAIKNALKSDPYAPMNINKSLVNTDDYLLSDEEKNLKADLSKIKFDTDPKNFINDLKLDYSAMSNVDAKVADITADWDVSDIDSALNCKDPYTGNYSKNSSTINIYQNLEQMKPGLKEHIKASSRLQHFYYNEQSVERYLNYFITETAREAIQAKYHDQLPELYPNTVLTTDATLRDLCAYLVAKVNDELSEGNTAFSTDWKSSGFDPLISSTSDYFLTPDEIEQKEQMNNKKSAWE